MLSLKRLAISGFGPFAAKQLLEFPTSGVTVIYGENMRGKSSLLDAVRYALYGRVLGRGSRVRRLHSISNRELASQGEYGFTVSLTLDRDGEEYELLRSCLPRVAVPSDDNDYHQEVLLRRGSTALGPQERDHALQQILPAEVARFFLFDGELLQEYEELLINESDAGRRISEAVERILGVPVLKRGRVHLTQLSDEADKLAAREASKYQETEALGTALDQATDQKAAHQKEITRLSKQLQDLNGQRAEVEQFLQSTQKYASILQERDDANARLDTAAKEERALQGDLKRLMGEAWRTLLRDTVRTARSVVQDQAEQQIESFVQSLRRRAIDAAHCDTCDQDIPYAHQEHLRLTLSTLEAPPMPPASVSSVFTRLADLNKFADADNAGEVRQLWGRLQDLKIEQVTQRDRIIELSHALEDSDPETIRHSRTSYAEISDKIAVVKRGIEEEGQKAEEIDRNIQRLKERLQASGTPNLRATQNRAKILRQAAEIFGIAVEEYKTKLRSRVEATASALFLSMTTEKQDYSGLVINQQYGLSILHRDGQLEEARSAGAEHVVALALIGALQQNAPLRGPIVMDSPFGRLDEQHTANVVQTLPDMAEQVVILVYEAEVERDSLRTLLGSRLKREYRLDRISSRRTEIREVR